MKKIYWLGDSFETLTRFSKQAKRHAGYSLDKIQRGVAPADWKPMHAVGKGVKEIRIHAENEYRVFYVTQRAEGIYVLHAFVKKTAKTSRKDIELGRQRYKALCEI